MMNFLLYDELFVVDIRLPNKGYKESFLKFHQKTLIKSYIELGIQELLEEKSLFVKGTCGKICIAINLHLNNAKMPTIQDILKIKELLKSESEFYQAFVNQIALLINENGYHAFDFTENYEAEGKILREPLIEGLTLETHKEIVNNLELVGDDNCCCFCNIL